jgi:hypothetical protein
LNVVGYDPEYGVLGLVDEAHPTAIMNNKTINIQL